MEAAAVRTISHYSSDMDILLVGEGDFSFAASLARAFQYAPRLFATSLDSREMLHINYGSLIIERRMYELSLKGVVVLNAVDLRTIVQHPSLRHLSFARIIYNFPHSGFVPGLNECTKSLIRKHRQLMRAFFKNARVMLKVGGQVHVAHHMCKPYSSWRLQEEAAKSGLQLRAWPKFEQEVFSDYTPRRGAGDNANGTFLLRNPVTFIFILPYSSPHSCINPPPPLCTIPSHSPPPSLKPCPSITMPCPPCKNPLPPSITIPCPPSKKPSPRKNLPPPPSLQPCPSITISCTSSRKKPPPPPSMQPRPSTTIPGPPSRKNPPPPPPALSCPPSHKNPPFPPMLQPRPFITISCPPPSCKNSPPPPPPYIIPFDSPLDIISPALQPRPSITIPFPHVIPCSPPPQSSCPSKIITTPLSLPCPLPIIIPPTCPPIIIPPSHSIPISVPPQSINSHQLMISHQDPYKPPFCTFKRSSHSECYQYSNLDNHIISESFPCISSLMWIMSFCTTRTQGEG